MDSDEKNKGLCSGCTICCEHVALEIDKPETKEELLRLLDYLNYNDILVWIEENGEWYVQFKTKCKQLDENGYCKIYEKRPKICREYSQEECEKYGDGEFYEHLFKTREEFLDFIKKDPELSKIFSN